MTYAQVEALVSKFADKLKCVEVSYSFKSTMKFLSITWNFSSCDYFVLHIQISLFSYSCVVELWHFSLEQVSVENVSMKSFQERDEEINRVAEIASVSLKAGKDTLLVTSRQLVTGKCQYFPFFSVCAFSFICRLMILSFLLCLWIFLYMDICFQSCYGLPRFHGFVYRKNRITILILACPNLVILSLHLTKSKAIDSVFLNSTYQYNVNLALPKKLHTSIID